jgi:hypothetical protein
MPRDRLADLKQATPNAGADVDAGGAGEKYMDDFFEQVEEIRSTIDSIAECVEQMKQKQSEILSNTTNDPSALAPAAQACNRNVQNCNKSSTS